MLWLPWRHRTCPVAVMLWDRARALIGPNHLPLPALPPPASDPNSRMNRLPNGLLTALRASRPAPRSAFGAGIPPGSAGHVKKPDLLRMRPVELKCIFARFELLSFAPGASFFWQREPFRKFQEQPRSLRD